MLPLERSAAELNAQPSLLVDNQLAFAFACQPEDILDLFEETTQQLGFELIEREPTYATAVRKPEKRQGLLSIINCFSWWQMEGVTAIKISLSKQTLRGTLRQNFVAQVKGLAGATAQVHVFLNKLEESLTKHGYCLSSAHIVMEATAEEPNLEQQNPFHLQACSHHIVGKLLLNEQYGIGKGLDKLVEDYRGSFKNLEESVGLLPGPMRNAISMAGQIAEQLEALLVKLSYPRQMLPFARLAAERYVFSKIEDQMYNIYRLRALQTELVFQKKRETILSSYTLKQILTEVCLNQKFWSVNKEKMDQILDLKDWKQNIYFSAACRQVEKVVFTHSPREKIKYCQMGYTQLKNHFYDYSHRKYQLASMEDIIPVLIVIVLLLEVGSLRAEFDAMLDFVANDPHEMQAQKRLLINFSESYNYIARDWIINR